MASIGIVVELPCEGNRCDDLCEVLLVLLQGVMLVRLVCSRKVVCLRLLC